MTTSILPNNNVHLNNRKDTQLFDFIQSKTVGDVLTKVKPNQRELLDLPLTSTMEEALDLLLAQDILSVPIYRLNENNNVKEYITIVSALDLLKLLSTKVSIEHLQKDKDTLLIPLSDAIHMTEKLTILKSTDSLDKLLNLFSFEKTHRVLIQQAEDNSIVLLSQMDLIRFFQAFNHQLGSAILDLTVPQIHRHGGIRNSINYKCTAAEAFLKLAGDESISSLPIIDDNGELIGEISAKDLRGLNRNRWDSLLKPVVMFLKASQGDIYAPLTCHQHFTLSQIMSAFVLRKAYRLWWTDNTTGELKGVITLTDVLSTFASFNQ